MNDVKADPLFSAVIFGEPASKANSRRIVSIGGKVRSIKSSKALSYIDAFNMQCKALSRLIDVDVEARLIIYYASRRPDLDESVILDALQGKAYVNDRQVKRKVVEWGLDPARPRAVIELYAYTPSHGPSLPSRRSAGSKGRSHR